MARSAYRSANSGIRTVSDGERYCGGRPVGHGHGIAVRTYPASPRRDAGRHHRYLGRTVNGLSAKIRSQGRHRHSVARILGDSQVTSRQSRGSEIARDEAIDAAATAAFTTQYGTRATQLPPLAIVIAEIGRAHV